MYGLTQPQLRAQPQQSTGLFGVSTQQANGIDITSLMNLMIPMMMVMMMMKMMTGAMGGSSTKMKPVKQAL